MKKIAGSPGALMEQRMSHLAIRLLGAFRIRLEGIHVNAFRTKKNQALLAYLALESNRPHRRDTLAALFWPEQPETKAHNSLRQSLYLLRQLLTTGTGLGDHLLISPDEVQLNPNSDHWIDVVEFKKLLSDCKAHHPQGAGLCPGCLEHLNRALELYQGELLAGFSLQGCTQFDEWQVCNQESCHNHVMIALSMLTKHFETIQDYDQLIQYAQREIELEPWHEPSHQRKMMALTWSGQRGRALLQYETLRGILQRDLGTRPSEETRSLYEQIRTGLIPQPEDSKQNARLPSVESIPNHADAANIFAGRQPELVQLSGYLEEALSGRGRVAFVCGEAGIGKTALMNEFARRAMHTYPDLLLVRGSSCTYSGVGTPYQPFREVLGMLAGIFDVPLAWAKISTEHAQRLFEALPALLLTLLDTSPGLVGALIPAPDLIRRLREAIPYSDGNAARLEAWLARLESLQSHATLHSPVAYLASEPSLLMQADVIDQVARLLLRLSHHFPLLILLDDLQWSNSSSINMLFHLGHHLAGGRILLLGAYRPEDIVSISDGNHERHPLMAVLNEFQRIFGEIQVDLAQSDSLAFLCDYLDSEPNHLDQDFREKFWRHTGGNALFVVELLRAFQERGELVRDKTGHWVLRPALDWERLPARVEAVIAERLGRLDRACLALLEAASVQGEVFIADVLAQVLGIPLVTITASLSGALCKQHHLVSCQPWVVMAGRQKACYRFRHFLYQKYLYQGLDEVERTNLHKATAEALASIGV